MQVSIIIRTYNEQTYLEELLVAISNQNCKFEYEIVIVDSGSNDNTLNIIKKFDTKLIHLKKEEFSFGHSLNLGCKASTGEYLVFISGHCVPENENWLHQLIEPLVAGTADYTFGTQKGRDTTKFSEYQIFEKYFPKKPHKENDRVFCNNANAAIKKDVWRKYSFNETLTGLEDIYLSQQLMNDGGKVEYVPSSSVYHIHAESWRQILNRYEREAVAIAKIAPNLSIKFYEMIYFICNGIYIDLNIAFKKKVLIRELFSIVMFRCLQYYGGYRGNIYGRKYNHYIYPSTKNPLIYCKTCDLSFREDQIPHQCKGKELTELKDSNLMSNTQDKDCFVIDKKKYFHP